MDYFYYFVVAIILKRTNKNFSKQLKLFTKWKKTVIIKKFAAWKVLGKKSFLTSNMQRKQTQWKTFDAIAVGNFWADKDSGFGTLETLESQT